MRVTIDRKFTIKADLKVTGVDDNCTTTAASIWISLSWMARLDATKNMIEHPVIEMVEQLLKQICI